MFLGLTSAAPAATITSSIRFRSAITWRCRRSSSRPRRRAYFCSTIRRADTIWRKSRRQVRLYEISRSVTGAACERRPRRTRCRRGAATPAQALQSAGTSRDEARGRTEAAGARTAVGADVPQLQAGTVCAGHPRHRPRIAHQGVPARRATDARRKKCRRDFSPRSAAATIPEPPLDAIIHRPPQGAGELDRQQGQSAHRARDGEPDLAVSLRQRTRDHARATSATAAARRRIPSCSTGWPPSSWTTAGP